MHRWKKMVSRASGEVFFHMFDATYPKKVLLFMYHAGSYTLIKDPLIKLRVQFYPKNYTCLDQPMYMGIITAVNFRCRNILLFKSAKVFDQRKQFQEMYKKLPHGTRSISELYLAHLLEVMQILLESCNVVEAGSISKCLLKSKTLSVVVSSFFRRSTGSPIYTITLINLLGKRIMRD